MLLFSQYFSNIEDVYAVQRSVITFLGNVFVSRTALILTNSLNGSEMPMMMAFRRLL